MKELATLIAAALIVSGCGKPNSTNSNESSRPSGSNSQSTTQESARSAASGKTVTEADLGLPFYPASTEIPQATMSITQANETLVSSGRATKDSPDKVAAFYKPKITAAKPQTKTKGVTHIATLDGKLKDGGEVSVIARKDGTNDTEILVSVTRKK